MIYKIVIVYRKNGENNSSGSKNSALSSGHCKSLTTEVHEDHKEKTKKIFAAEDYKCGRQPIGPTACILSGTREASLFRGEIGLFVPGNTRYQLSHAGVGGSQLRPHVCAG